MYLVNIMSRLLTFAPIFFVVCNCGESVTSAFDDMDEVVYEMEWYACPIELQKYLIAMLAIIRRPVVFNGLFSMDCSRFTFKRVNLCKNAFFEPV